MKKAYISSNGCQAANTQVQQYAQTLAQEGFLLTPRLRDADLVVLDLCSFTAVAQQESIELAVAINKQRKAESRFVITGCYLGINPDHLQKIIPDAEYVTKEELRRRAGNNSNSPKVPGYIDEKGILRLKIEDGCGGACTFCAIPEGIGRRYSYPLPLISSTVEDYVSFHPGSVIQFVGEDIGFYGLDRKEGTTIISLLQKMEQLTGNFQIRLEVVNPWWFLRFPELTETLANGVEKGRVVPYLGIPLQSGSNRILGLMKRLYTSEQFEEIVEGLERRIPGMGLASEVIVGFPGETEDDFRKTFEVIDRHIFNPLGIWGYTDLPNTKASSLTDKVKPVLIKERVEILTTLIVQKEMERQGYKGIEELMQRLELQSERLPIATNVKNLFG